jgi:hypothetical protein
VRPRLQEETWSLYWKEPMRTDTRCLPDVEAAAEAGETLQQLLSRVAATLGWAPADRLLRLEGFTGGPPHQARSTQRLPGRAPRAPANVCAWCPQETGSARCTRAVSCS